MDFLGRGAHYDSSYSTSTALRSACFYGYLDIVKVLVEDGADIESVDDKGATCLILACDNGHYEVVKYLIDVGANVNRKKNDGKTALHLSAKSGHLEILKMLLSHNACMYVDTYGLKPIMEASYAVQGHIVEYIATRNDTSTTTKEKLDALLVLGASLLDDKQDMEGAVKYWKLAMILRSVNDTVNPPIADDDVPSCEFCEVTTLKELEEIETNRDALELQSLLFRERILGLGHGDTLQRISIKGEYYANTGNFKKCFDLWMRALDVRQENREDLFYCRHYIIMSFRKVFTGLIEKEYAHCSNITPKTYFGDLIILVDKIAIEVEMASSILNRYRQFQCKIDFKDLQLIYMTLLQFLSLLTALKPDLNVFQWCRVKGVVYQIVRKDPRCPEGATLLHLACTKPFQGRSCSLIKTTLPSLEVVNLLLETGANPRAIDHNGNTPLHVIAMNEEFFKEIVDVLLSAGAHLDAVNRRKQTFASIRAQYGHSTDNQVDTMSHTSLQCLAASCIRRHDIPYKTILTPRLEEFVDMH
ncbi:protein fem-1 homolog C-like [Palaemon carinicauda]|uniref:protein fem-1 homolog C-like n=1 Tax=Palaemon carinicauda TaxID=392227 RepID=UPI0035B5AE18